MASWTTCVLFWSTDLTQRAGAEGVQQPVPEHRGRKAEPQRIAAVGPNGIRAVLLDDAVQVRGDLGDRFCVRRRFITIADPPHRRQDSPRVRYDLAGGQTLATEVPPAVRIIAVRLDGENRVVLDGDSVPH
jgi:hypothetical protein